MIVTQCVKLGVNTLPEQKLSRGVESVPEEHWFQIDRVGPTTRRHRQMMEQVLQMYFR